MEAGDGVSHLSGAETPYADALLRRPRHDPDLMTGVFLGLTGLTSLWK